MEKDTKVSIIVPVYNTEKYLEKCLNSLIVQTLKEIEIICVDDGSSDNSLKILQQFKNKDYRIKLVLQNREKQGSARNKGIKIAKGEYIGFVDSDDYVQNNFFEELYYKAKQFESDIACANIIRKRDNTQKYRLFNKETVCISAMEEKLKVCTSINGDYNWNVWNKIYKKDFLIRNNILFEEGVYFEDVNFTIKAIHLSNLIVTAPNAVYYYYARPNSVVKGKQDKKKRNDLLNAYIKLHSYCLNNNIHITKTNSYCTRIYLKFFNLIILSSRTKFEDKWIINKFKLFNVFSIYRKKEINSNICYSYPVDIVYSWCDGKDKAFRAEREFWRRKLGISTTDANFSCQWEDNDELKYSLRSLEKYASWIRNIYIITNSQKPEWLKESDKVKVIDVSDIMPSDSLPTFNSQAIETRIPFIEGLAEHFLYSNDDMFFNNPVDKSFFFNEEAKPIVRLQGKISRKTYDKSLYARTVVQAQNKIENVYGVKIRYSPHHCIDSYTKTCFLECVKEFEKDFNKTCYQKFRCEDSIQRAIILYGALAKNKAILRLTKRFLFSRDSKCISLNCPEKLKHLNSNLIKLFCINDDSRATIDDKKQIMNFLQNKFSEKSSYEL